MLRNLILFENLSSCHPTLVVAGKLLVEVAVVPVVPGVAAVVPAEVPVVPVLPVVPGVEPPVQ